MYITNRVTFHLNSESDLQVWSCFAGKGPGGEDAALCSKSSLAPGLAGQNRSRGSAGDLLGSRVPKFGPIPTAPAHPTRQASLSPMLGPPLLPERGRESGLFLPATGSSAAHPSCVRQDVGEARRQHIRGSKANAQEGWGRSLGDQRKQQFSAGRRRCCGKGMLHWAPGSTSLTYSSYKETGCCSSTADAPTTQWSTPQPIFRKLPHSRAMLSSSAPRRGSRAHPTSPTIGDQRNTNQHTSSTCSCLACSPPRSHRSSSDQGELKSKYLHTVHAAHQGWDVSAAQQQTGSTQPSCPAGPSLPQRCCLLHVVSCCKPLHWC